MALTFTLMLGFTALAIDVGRFYAERRFLQDSVDAAALACARAYSQAGATSTTAYNAARTILESYNLKNSPNGLSYTVPAETGRTYYDNIVSAQYLKNGILPQLSPYTGCRVAVYIDVPTTLLQIANPGLQTIALNARSYAIAKGGMIPVVVPKYSNGPGPGNGSTSNFIHHTMAENQDYQCSTSADAGCTAASSTTKGREFVLFGASQKATNDNSFRGYIAPDVRDFQYQVNGVYQHTSYNGVAANATVDTLKGFEANWILEGYPGPDLCTISTTSFLPCAEVAVINGASAGIFIDPIRDRFQVGDKILVQLYDGTVKTVPNFTINFPTLVLATPGAPVADQNVQFTYSGQFAASNAQVRTTFFSDNGTITGDGVGDALNPWNTGLATSGTFTSNPTPNGTATSYTQVWSGITTQTATPQGIYAVFLKGVSEGEYAGIEQLDIVTVNVADQKEQFFIDTSDTYVSTTAGTNATYTVRVTDGAGQNKWSTPHSSFPITLKIDQCPKKDATTLTCYFGTTAPGSPTATISGLSGTATLTVEVPTGTPSSKTYSGWIRAFGLDDGGQKVTRVLPFRTAVGVTPGGATDYVDVLGFAVFEVTYLDANDVKGKAITGWSTNVNDPALAIGKKYGLVPWETP